MKNLKINKRTLEGVVVVAIIKNATMTANYLLRVALLAKKISEKHISVPTIVTSANITRLATTNVLMAPKVKVVAVDAAVVGADVDVAEVAVADKQMAKKTSSSKMVKMVVAVAVEVVEVVAVVAVEVVDVEATPPPTASRWNTSQRVAVAVANAASTMEMRKERILAVTTKSPT